MSNQEPTLLDKAKKLRTNSTDAEHRLWYYLRANRLKGFKFKRQKPIGKYIVDFVCMEKKLIIELDGGQHLLNKQYDESRTNYLNSMGYQVLRFWNNELLLQTQEALEIILKNLET